MTAGSVPGVRSDPRPAGAARPDDRRGAPSAGRGDRTPLLQRPLASYHLLLTSTLLLLVLGLVMVFSASIVRSYDSTGSAYATGMKQATFICVGLPMMLVAARLPVRVFRAAAYPLLVAVVVLLVLVLAVGHEVKGARSWIALPLGFNLQPAELAKLGLAIWGADLLVRKQRLLGEHRHLLVPLLPVSGLVLVLILLQPDFGTAVSVSVVVVALLWVAGTPLRLFAGLCAFVAVAAGLLAVSAPHRVERLLSFRDPFADAGDTGYQAVQGFYALSSGGWFGLGLGASREKWSGGLPEAHTDYVFAIVGEELGLLGTLTVLVLFAVLVYSGVRIAQRATDPFVRLAASGVTGWIAAQAIINMGAVVGLLPITGIPLPLVSFGGSALLVTLAAIGMLLAFARQEPGAAEALRRRGGLRGGLRQGLRGGLRGGRSGGAGAPASAGSRRRTADAGRPVPRTPGRTAGRAPARTAPRPAPSGGRPGQGPHRPAARR
ncbi:MAG: Cell division protein FtsW [uncultured Frankineae bacterium]|uniref:Probable peptidoglycan glycosyltransferase FtsW n=1 Tax=uncultured Frankineae bacterium TaxID=437475 RepID=A0A6J4KKX1_9ACTN|nr:MAG: Cell division protein FtsW [uncultured Frankineae bacterium]